VSLVTSSIQEKESKKEEKSLSNMDSNNVLRIPRPLQQLENCWFGEVPLKSGIMRRPIFLGLSTLIKALSYRILARLVGAWP
jgi:hypothetical protein